MEEKLKSVTWGKYLDTDIDSVTLFWDNGKFRSFVGEFDVPWEELHSVYYSRSEDGKIEKWIEIVNPQDVVEHEDATLPDITVQVNGSKYPLRDIIVQLVKEHETTNQDD